MHINNIKKQIKYNFSKSANRYNAWAIAQKKSATHLVSLIDKNTFKSILDIGCGTGFCIEALKKTNCNKITGIDLSPGMVDVCTNKWPSYNFICTDAEHFFTQEKYDLIISNFTLQWFNNIYLYIKNCFDNLLKKNGTLALAIPVEGSLNEFTNIIKTKLHPFPNSKDLIESIGGIKKIDANFEIKNYKLSYPSPLAGLKAIKKIGAHYKDETIISIGEMKQLKSFHNDKDFSLTYKVLFIKATKT